MTKRNASRKHLQRANKLGTIIKTIWNQYLLSAQQNRVYFGFFVHHIINWCLWLDRISYFIISFFLSHSNPVVHEGGPPCMAELSQWQFLISLDIRRTSRLVYLRPENPFLWRLIEMVKPDVLMYFPGDEVFQVVYPLLWHAMREGGHRGEKGYCEKQEGKGASHSGQDGMEVRLTSHSFILLPLDRYKGFNLISHLCPLSKSK